MKRIVVLVAEGFEESELIVPVDVLRRAHFQVILMSLNALEVVSAHGIKIIADQLWEDDVAADAIFLPGGDPGTSNLLADERVMTLIRRFEHEGKIISALCAAPSVLAKAGILKDKNVTSYPIDHIETIFAMAHYQIADIVIDGQLITGRGVGKAFPFAYALASALGADVDRLKQIMVYSGK